MRYFTEWIPVEGEIKEGLMVLDKLSGDIFPWIDGDNWDNNDTLVKLFLCSRDIQVGDKAITPRGEGECIQRRASVRWPDRQTIIVSFGPGNDDTEGYFLDEDDVYKVIGEVSPEATWVKKGDEFDDSEIGYWFRGNTKPTPLSKLSKEEKELALERLINKFDRPLYLKGPCGHFH